MKREITTLIRDVTDLLHQTKTDRAEKADRFNVFNILNITSDEVRLHSKFLAELLDPKGSHDQGTLFLEKFLELTHCQLIFTDLTKVKVRIEHFIGPKTPVTGGRIDILLIDDKSCAVVIENKIFAGDQENQLLRYYNYCEKLKAVKGRYSLLYLTLDGKCASEWSTGNVLQKEHYQSVSYMSHIKLWLEECCEATNHLPKLSTSLEHYIQLIDQLTGISMDHELQNTITERIINDSSSFEAATAVSSSITNAKFLLLNRFGQQLTEALKVNTGATIFLSDKFGMKWEGIEIFNNEPGDPRDRNPHIRFSFLSEAGDCYIEIHPGLSEGNALVKNHKKRLRYADLLNDYFSSPDFKVQNTEKYWQGEWVCRYFKLDNVFTQLIEDPEQLLCEAAQDLEFIYMAFTKVEMEIEVPEKNILS